MNKTMNNLSIRELAVYTGAVWPLKRILQGQRSYPERWLIKRRLRGSPAAGGTRRVTDICYQVDSKSVTLLQGYKMMYGTSARGVGG